METTPVLDAETYTLREAAQVLGIDFKTLKKRIDQAKVAPERDPADQRARLLSREDVAKLAHIRRRLYAAGDGDPNVSRLLDSFKNLAGRVARLEDVESRLQSSHESLTQRTHGDASRLRMLEESQRTLTRQLEESERASRELRRQLEELRTALAR